MDYSQVIAAQKLSDDARKRHELSEDEFYQRHGVTICETLKNWMERALRRAEVQEKVKTQTNCPPAVEKLC